MRPPSSPRQAPTSGRLHLYAYADGNPVKNTDKTGFCVPCAIVAGAATILGMGMSAPSDTKQAPASVWGMVASVGGPPVIGNAISKVAVGLAEKYIPGIVAIVRGGAAAGTKATASAAPAGNAATKALTARAKEVHKALDPIAAKQRTTAVLQTNKGNVVGGGKRDLSPAQRAVLTLLREVHPRRASA